VHNIYEYIIVPDMTAKVKTQKLNPRKTVRIIALVLTFIWFIFVTVLFLIRYKTGNIILIRVLGLHLRQVGLMYISGLIVVAWCIYGLIKAWRKVSKRLAKVSIVLAWILLISAFLLGSLVMLLDIGLSKYYEFKSPYYDHTLVAREYTFLLLGNVSFYERANPFFIEDLDANIMIDDGYAAISQGAYWIKWDKDTVTLAVDVNEGGLWRKVIIDMEPQEKEVLYESFYPKGEPADKADEADSDRLSQAQLNRHRVEEAILIPGSDFGLVEMDRAMARRLWYFVEIKDQQMTYLSEAPDTAPEVEGTVDSDGNIYLHFTSIEGEKTSYKSVDNGKTWIGN
jgi:hypothetical protein